MRPCSSTGSSCTTTKNSSDPRCIAQPRNTSRNPMKTSCCSRITTLSSAINTSGRASWVHMTRPKRSSLLCLLAPLAVAALAQDHTANIPKANRGYTDTPLVPGQQWHVHDPVRPYPEKVAPGKNPGDPPADAIVLFDG